jgi:hypothetical protein
MTVPRALVALSAAMLTIVAVPARAQSAADRKRPPPRKVLRLDELKVEGRIHKPQAMFLMPRANLGYRELDRSEPLLPKVVKAVQKDPF